MPGPSGGLDDPEERDGFESSLGLAADPEDKGWVMPALARRRLRAKTTDKVIPLVLMGRFVAAEKLTGARPGFYFALEGASLPIIAMMG